MPGTALAREWRHCLPSLTKRSHHRFTAPTTGTRDPFSAARHSCQHLAGYTTQMTPALRVGPSAERCLASTPPPPPSKPAPPGQAEGSDAGLRHAVVAPRHACPRDPHPHSGPVQAASVPLQSTIRGTQHVHDAVREQVRGYSFACACLHACVCESAQRERRVCARSHRSRAVQCAWWAMSEQRVRVWRLGGRLASLQGHGLKGHRAEDRPTTVVICATSQTTMTRVPPSQASAASTGQSCVYVFGGSSAHTQPGAGILMPCACTHPSCLFAPP